MSVPSSGLTALVVGGTGAVGAHVVRALLASPKVSHVHAFGRRSTTVGPHPKLTEHEPLDFDVLLHDAAAPPLDSTELGALDDAYLGPEGRKLRDVQADAVFITLGTTRAAAGSAATFEKVDRDYTLSVAVAALSPEKIRTTGQTLLYCSASGSSSSSSFLYPKSKGLTEEQLVSLPYSKTIIFRPAMLLNANRAESRLLEVAAEPAVKLLSKVWNGAGIDVADVGRAMCALGTPGPKTITLDDLRSTYHVAAPPPSGEGFVTALGRAQARAEALGTAQKPIAATLSNAELLKLAHEYSGAIF